jgi:RNA polymerase-binding transcription factor
MASWHGPVDARPNRLRGLDRQLSQNQCNVLPANQSEHFKQVLQTRISELDHALATTEHEAREGATKQADPADQAASEYERQSLVHKAATARRMLKDLTQALERMRQGTFGECAECGGDIELKRLEAIPWARYCVKFRKQGSGAEA